MINTLGSSEVLWTPTEERINNANITKFINWLKKEKQLSFSTYEEVWQWSVEDLESFWACMWEYFEIDSLTPYEKVVEGSKMWQTKWFTGTKLNYTEHIFKNRQKDSPALIFKNEKDPLIHISWDELYDKVVSLAHALKDAGIKNGDRVVGFLPNIPEAVVSVLACASIGAVWSSCSPDFGSKTIVERFEQIEPKVLIAVDGYTYGGREYDRTDVVDELQQKIKSLEKTILIPYLNEKPVSSEEDKGILWDEFLSRHKGKEIVYEHVPFDHPLWILFSSGTTGIPKAIVHSQGGILIEQYKMFALNMDVSADDRFFWFTTTGWMMWNSLVGNLLTGATILLYDGSPTYPNVDVLWEFAEETKMTFFGTSAVFIQTCIQQGLSPKEKYDLQHLKTIGSTASPLSEQGYKWVYEHVKADLWLSSTSGGTDICASIIGGVPTLPVVKGELQARNLGVAAYAYDDNGIEVINEVGELVIIKPLPSMPIYFWNDENNEKLIDSYYDTYDNVWRHGDWIAFNSHGGSIIYGRSDSTINRGGIRIGTSEIYNVIESLEYIKDSLVIDIKTKKDEELMLLFIVLKESFTLTNELTDDIKQAIRTNCSPRHTPNEIYEIIDVPETLNGKKLEVPIKRILMGESIDKVLNKGSVRNIDSIDFFIKLASKYK